MTPLYLTDDEVLTVAHCACDEMQVVVRDRWLLQSAVARPSAQMFGQEAYADVFDKAAALLQGLAINHPLFDGNKRTAWLSCMTFLRLCGVSLRPDIDAAERLVVGVAAGEIREVRQIAAGLRALCEER